ncbi:MAG: hypothetical protein ACOC2H_06660 [Spirochaetota bacterium]
MITALLVLFASPVICAASVYPARVELALGYPSGGIAFEYLLPVRPFDRSISLGVLGGYFPFTVYTETREGNGSTGDSYTFTADSLLTGGVRSNLYFSGTGSGVFISLCYNFLQFRYTETEDHYYRGRIEEQQFSGKARIHVFSLRAGYRRFFGRTTISAEAGLALEYLPDTDVHWEHGYGSVRERVSFGDTLVIDPVVGLSAGYVL